MAGSDADTDLGRDGPRRCCSFILAADGTLTYARTQGEKQRDSLDITKASIGRSKKRRHIVIDSLVEDKLPWHCKALSEEDFEKCVSAMRLSSAEEGGLPLLPPRLTVDPAPPAVVLTGYGKMDRSLPQFFARQGVRDKERLGCSCAGKHWLRRPRNQQRRCVRLANIAGAAHQQPECERPRRAPQSDDGHDPQPREGRTADHWILCCGLAAAGIC